MIWILSHDGVVFHSMPEWEKHISTCDNADCKLKWKSLQYAKRDFANGVMEELKDKLILNRFFDEHSN